MTLLYEFCKWLGFLSGHWPRAVGAAAFMSKVRIEMQHRICGNHHLLVLRLPDSVRFMQTMTYVGQTLAKDIGNETFQNRRIISTICAYSQHRRIRAEFGMYYWQLAHDRGGPRKFALLKSEADQPL